ncbi:hypothetical protein BJI56_05935 [Acinetobacter nosocomialis]|nr:hypothetical protein BJI56_05935 [Acinetobacter nosocomialis]
MLDDLSFFQKVGIFVQPIILVIMGIYGPKSLRNVSWAMLFFYVNYISFLIYFEADGCIQAYQNHSDIKKYSLFEVKSSIGFSNYISNTGAIQYIMLYFDRKL